MKYENLTHTDEHVGGGYLGVISYVPYSKLLAEFGEPNDSDAYKVSTEWDIRFEDGLCASIYDWKASDLYEDGAYPVSTIRSDSWDSEWHIGGTDPVVIERIRTLLGLED